MVDKVRTMTRSSTALLGWFDVVGIACFAVDVARPAATGPVKPERTATRVRGASTLPADPAAADSARIALRKYCVTCHNERLKTAGLTLESLDIGLAAARPEVW